MPNSPRWSRRSAACRRKADARAARAASLDLEWRPSRLLAAMLALIGALSALGAFASDLPAPAAWPLAALALGRGMRLARIHLRLPPRRLRWDARGAVLDGVALASPRLRWRGPMAVLHWCDAADDGDGDPGRGGARGPGRPRVRRIRTRRLAWWPDTLPPAARRELRLAAARWATRAPPGGVAP